MRYIEGGYEEGDWEERSRVILEALQYHAPESGSYLLVRSIIMNIFKMDQRKISTVKSENKELNQPSGAPNP